MPTSMITSKDMVRRRAISSNDRSGADPTGGERVALVRFMKVREAGDHRPARLQLAGTANSKAQKPGKSAGGYAVVSCQTKPV